MPQDGRWRLLRLQDLLAQPLLLEFFVVLAQALVVSQNLHVLSRAARRPFESVQDLLSLVT